MTPSEMVLQFHKTYGQPVRHKPSLDVPESVMRYELIREEFEEFRDALGKRDIVEVADALADLVYVIYGAAHTWGIPLDDVLAEVQRSNMSKLDPETGKPIYRGDGKVLKGADYFPPDIRTVLFPESEV